MLDIDQIRQLVEMMVTNDLVEISLRDGEEEVNLRRPNAAAAGANLETIGAAHTPNPAVAQAAPAATTPAAATPEESDDAELVEIQSPMVGTYYSSPDPDSPVFVKLGQQIQVGTVMCIVEAMKVFNEIKSEVAGIIERILVKNAQAVEFGQPLFAVRPL